MSDEKSVDSSNSPPSGFERNSLDDSADFQCAPGRAGIDTVSFVWRWESRSAFLDVVENFDEHRLELPRAKDSAMALDPIRFSGSFRRGYWCEEPLPGGLRWGISMRSDSIFAEGRLGACVNGDADDHSLPPARALNLGMFRCATDLLRLLAPEDWQDVAMGPWQSGRCALRRLDIASEIETPSALGLQLLSAFSSIASAGKRPVTTWARNGRVETVYLRERSGSVRARIYDKGVESGEGLPGTLLRFERQVRWAKPQQPFLLEVANDASIAARLWAEGFKPWFGKVALTALDPVRWPTGSVPEVRVYPIEKAIDLVLDEVEAGRLLPTTGERLVGSLMISKMRGEQWWGDHASKDAGYRRLRELRDLGIHTSGLAGSAEVVPLSAPLSVAFTELANERAAFKPKASGERHELPKLPHPGIDEEGTQEAA